LHESLNYAFNLEKMFASFCQKQKPDLVLLADYAAEGFFIFLKRLEGQYKDIPFLLELQGSTYDCLKYNAPNVDNFFDEKSPWDKLQSYMENYTIPLADYLVAPSQKSWEQMTQRLRLESEHRIIPNSVNQEVFQLKPPVLKKENDAKTVVYVGRLEKRKGVDFLLEGFISILNENPEIDVELVFLGRDLYWEEYEESFQKYWQQRIPNTVKEKVKFLGHSSQETIRDYLSNAWVAVFPSRWEPFGNVCLEAMYLGCPVIVTQNTGLMEIVGTNYDILFDKAEGVAGLKSKILQIIQDVNLRNNLAIKSHLRAKELLLNEEILTSNYVEVIRQESS
jgi:glycosyltransferase involved in cell wall biosynthesis